MDGYKTLRVAELLLDKEASSRWTFPVRDTLRSAAGVPGDQDGGGDHDYYDYDIIMINRYEHEDNDVD